jgi:hypothetical protein
MTASSFILVLWRDPRTLRSLPVLPHRKEQNTSRGPPPPSIRQFASLNRAWRPAIAGKRAEINLADCRCFCDSESIEVVAACDCCENSAIGMNNLLKLSVMVIFLVGASYTIADTAADFESTKKAFQESIGKIKSDTTGTKTCSANYVKALEKVVQTLQAAGNLDGLVAANKEKARFLKEGTAPGQPGTDIPAELAAVENTYNDSIKDLNAARDRKIAALASAYLDALGEMKKKLTQDGIIDKAMDADAEIKRVNNDPEIAAALAAEPAQEPASAAGQPKKSVTLVPGAKPTTATAASAYTPISKGLILYYPFNPGSDKNTADKSGKSGFGVVHGATWTADGKVGGAFVFDGRSGYIATTSQNNLNLTKEFSICLWMKPGKQSRGEIGIISKAKWRDAGYSVGMDQYHTNVVCFHAYGGDEPVLNLRSTSNAIVQDEWNHIAVTFDASSAAKIYRNGEEVGSGNAAGPVAKSAAKLVIGKYDEDAPAFNGIIDEVMIFNRVLSADEVRQIYDVQK